MKAYLARHIVQCVSLDSLSFLIGKGDKEVYHAFSDLKGQLLQLLI